VDARLESVDEVLTSSLCFWSDTQLIDRLDALHALSQRIAAAELALVREIDGRGVPRAQGAANITGWLRDRLRISGRTAGQWKRLADTAAAHPAGAAALAAGEVNIEQLAVIGDALAELPAANQRDAEACLLDMAAVHGPTELRVLRERLLFHLDPAEAERREAQRLARDEALAHERRYLTLTDVPGTAMVRVRGLLTRECAAFVRAAMDPLLSPRVRLPRVPPPRHNTSPTESANSFGWLFGPDGPDRTGFPDNSASDSSASGSSLADNGPSEHDCASGPGDDGPGDNRTGDSSPGDSDPGGAGERLTHGQRCADAFTDICRIALASGHLPDNGGDRPQLTVTIDLRHLRDQLGIATLDTGHTITAATARRLACDATIIPAVLNGPSQTLDIGRERRLFTGPIRRALILRDRGCAFPACDRPPRWCDGHHIHHWADGGPTNPTNGVLVCQFHHRLLHHSTWQVRINPNDGLPEFIPPAYLDPRQRPQRNRYHHRE
jgi:hypothetical protein